jgi:hypothetical protein
MHASLKKYDPSVDKKFLIAISGILWSVVGIMLCRLAVQWLSRTDHLHAVRLGSAGVVLAFLIYRFGFLKIVHKNTERILSKEGKVCIFAFQPWKSYLIILVMIGMGTILRHSSLPKPYLSVIYFGFGGAMTLSSLVYYRIFFKKLK